LHGGKLHEFPLPLNHPASRTAVRTFPSIRVCTLKHLAMAKFFDAIQPAHRQFIEHQKMFFVASAPLEVNGHVNLSPKGGDVFRILDPNKVAYLDYTVSGNETSAHLLQNGGRSS
jgi:hypothetical protein